MVFYFLYSLALTLGFILLLPRFLYDAIRKGKYAAGFRQRLGGIPDFVQNEKPVIWLHCVSVGETNAAVPLAAMILEQYPDYRLVVSTTTNTGQVLAKRLFADLADLIFYFPFDWRFSVRRVLKKIRPRVILIMETEIWFNFLRESHKRGAWIAIVNGRLSERSVNRYAYIQNFMKRVMHYVDLALMQGNSDADRILRLGIRSGKVRVTGNIKFDQIQADGESDLTESLRGRFAISSMRPLIIAASTHSPEEQWLLEAFSGLQKMTHRPRLLIAPRHPERFSEVAKLIELTGFKWTRRSDDPSPYDADADIILLDTIGELRAVYPLADLTFVGGSLIPHGGQSILEPARAGTAIITGYYTSNFADIVKEFISRDALFQIPDVQTNKISANLEEAFRGLLEDSEKRRNLAENAAALMHKNAGATKNTVELLKPILEHDKVMRR